VSDATRTGYLGIGSNVGDRRGHLQAAADLLAERGVRVLRSSSLYDTDPVGEIQDQPSFLNGVLEIETALEPIELLDVCKAVERERGRAAQDSPDYVKGGPRPLDVDVLLLGELEFEHERLRLPHREVTSRRFVLVPLLELNLSLSLPDGTVLADALANLPLDEGVRRAEDPLRV